MFEKHGIRGRRFRGGEKERGREGREEKEEKKNRKKEGKGEEKGG